METRIQEIEKRKTPQEELRRQEEECWRLAHLPRGRVHQAVQQADAGACPDALAVLANRWSRAGISIVALKTTTMILEGSLL